MPSKTVRLSTLLRALIVPPSWAPATERPFGPVTWERAYCLPDRAIARSTAALTSAAVSLRPRGDRAAGRAAAGRRAGQTPDRRCAGASVEGGIAGLAVGCPA